MIKNIIKRIFLMFGYSIRKVSKLSFSSMEPIKKKIEFIKKDSYVLDFEKVSLEGDLYFLPKYSKWLPIKQDSAGKNLYGTIYESTTHKLVAELFKSFKGSMIQAGAFCGDMLPSFSKSSNGFVYAFEPVLENYIMAKQTVIQNDLQNVFLFNTALGNKTETLRINTSIDQGFHIGGASRIDNVGDLCFSLAIDDLTYSHLILIQLDIEGFELSALKGAEKTIKKHCPIIAIEDNKKNCSEFLSLCGYISPMAIPGLDIWVHKEQTDYIEKLKNINL